VAAREALPVALPATDERVGAGRVVLFAFDPAYRGYANIQTPSVRPSGQGGCDKWGGKGNEYSDNPPPRPIGPRK